MELGNAYQIQIALMVFVIRQSVCLYDSNPGESSKYHSKALPISIDGQK